jgi:hypothetical protein
MPVVCSGLESHAGGGGWRLSNRAQQLRPMKGGDPRRRSLRRHRLDGIVSLGCRLAAHLRGNGSMKSLKHMLWRLPVLLGASALLTYGARATVADGSGDRNESAQADRTGEVVVKLENDQVYLSQDAGRTFEPLGLTATPEATHLKRLLQQGAHSEPGRIVKVAPTVVADGAGGWQWARPKDARLPDSAAHQADAPAPARPVADSDGATSGPKGSARARRE